MSEIRQLTLDLETVTPLFIAGAEPRGAPELRPPSFRGALRYWLRAALGGVIGADVDRVWREEAATFGSTDANHGGASPVVLRISHGNLPKVQPYVQQEPIIVDKNGKRLKQPTGRDYLYWSMAESGKQERGNYQQAKRFYLPGTAFQLSLCVRPGAAGADVALQRAAAAAWLLLHLGGIGSRSRRTAGSLSTSTPKEAGGLAFHLAAASPAAAAKEIGDGLARVRSAIGSDGRASNVARLPSFDVLHPTCCSIWVLGMWNSWAEAVGAIGAAMRDFRTYREPDRSNVARWLDGRAVPTVERAIFGLPLPYRYSSGTSATLQGRVAPPAIDRRASPLWLKVSRSVQGKYFGIATLFESAFLPANHKLHAKTRNQVPPVDPPHDYLLIKEWIRQKFPARQEVRYV